MTVIEDIREHVYGRIVRRLARMGTRDAVEALEALDRLSPAEIDLMVQQELLEGAA